MQADNNPTQIPTVSKGIKTIKKLLTHVYPSDDIIPIFHVLAITILQMEHIMEMHEMYIK